MNASALLLVLAALFFLMACLPPLARIPWLPLGLLVWVLAELVGRGVLH